MSPTPPRRNPTVDADITRRVTLEKAEVAAVERMLALSIRLSLAVLVAACLVPALIALVGVTIANYRLQRLSMAVDGGSLDALHRSLALQMVGVLMALVAIVWFALYLSRLVTRAVGALVDPALALGSGREIDMPPTGLRETEAVGRAIRQASRMLATAQHLAYHDPLTNLCNRVLFDEMATRQIAQAYRDGAQLAILALDLDGFKAVNDLHGHAAGDAVLQTVAARITGLLRASDVVSRRGGDEFSVLLVDVDGVKTRHIAEKLLAVLSQPYPDVVPAVSASIGVARYPRDATTLTDLLERADEALYAAKEAGKRRVVGDF